MRSHQDLFFHFTEVWRGLRFAGQRRFVCKEGSPETGGRGGRGGGRNERQMSAVMVEPAPKGSAVFETVSEGERRGWCRDKLMFGHRSGSYEKSGSTSPTGTLEFEVGDDDEEFPRTRPRQGKKDTELPKDDAKEADVDEEKEGESANEKEEEQRPSRRRRRNVKSR